MCRCKAVTVVALAQAVVEVASAQAKAKARQGITKQAMDTGAGPRQWRVQIRSPTFQFEDPLPPRPSDS